MSKKLYQPNKKQFNKEKMTIMDKLEVTVIALASVAVIAWSGFSIVDAFVPDPEPVVHEIMMDEIDSYVNEVNAEGSQAEQAEREEEERKAQEEAEKEAKKEAEEEAKKKAEEEKAKKEAEEKAKKEAAQKERRENAIKAREKLEEKLKQKAEANVVYTAKASLNIREEAKETAKSFGQYKPGDVLEVVEGENEEHPGWLKVRRGSTEGYVSAEFVEKK